MTMTTEAQSDVMLPQVNDLVRRVLPCCDQHSTPRGWRTPRPVCSSSPSRSAIGWRSRRIPGAGVTRCPWDGRVTALQFVDVSKADAGLAWLGAASLNWAPVGSPAAARRP